MDQRSRSVDSGGSEESGNFLEVPSRRFQRRRSSGGKGSVSTIFRRFKSHIDSPPVFRELFILISQHSFIQS